MTQNTKQKERNRRARQTTVEKLQEARDGVYVGDFVNEDGERRENVVLIPSKIFSSSEDAIFRSAEGYVGKYLLAAANENADFAEELDEGIESRRDHLEDLLGVSQEETALRQALDATSSETTTADIVRRLDELEEEKEDVDEQQVNKALDRLAQAQQFVPKSVTPTI